MALRQSARFCLPVATYLHKITAAVSHRGLSWTKWTCTALVLFATFYPQAAVAQQVYGKDFVNSVFTYETPLEPALTGAFSNWVTEPRGFGTDRSGFGYHYGVSLADNVNGKFMRKFAFAALSRHEDEFVPIATGGKLKRIGLALEHSILTTKGSEPKNFNWSGIPASLASASLSNAYQPPEQQSVSATFARFGTNCAGYAAGDVWKQLLQIVGARRIWYRVLTD
ncbi:MAG TPA: hypothetical protein VGR47_06190 [Terracidiphilus sp.]|nr:hypothetical protein [Terracidiphilus sp.]